MTTNYILTTCIMVIIITYLLHIKYICTESTNHLCQLAIYAVHIDKTPWRWPGYRNETCRSCIQGVSRL